MLMGGLTDALRGKNVPYPLYSLQILHGQAWDCPRASRVRDWWQSSCARVLSG